MQHPSITQPLPSSSRSRLSLPSTQALKLRRIRYSPWSLYRLPSAGAAENGFTPPSQAVASVPQPTDASSLLSLQHISTFPNLVSRATTCLSVLRVSSPPPKISFLELVRIRTIPNTLPVSSAIPNQKMFQRSPRMSCQTNSATKPE